MRPHAFVKGEFYHVYAHAIEGRNLFNNEDDYQRFIVAMFCANSSLPMPRIDQNSYPNLVWEIKDGNLDIGGSLVDIVSFCLMPTHIHLILCERGEGNISVFMHKLQVSFSKYYNIKYERRGHLFERSFNSKHIEDNDYLLSVSCYIHGNPGKITNWAGLEHNYPWSSYQDFIRDNRWGNLLSRDIILSQFNNQREYQEFFKQNYYPNLVWE